MISKSLSLYFYLLTRGLVPWRELHETMGIPKEELQELIKHLRQAGIDMKETLEGVYLEDDTVFSFLLSNKESELLEIFRELLLIKDRASLEKVTDIFSLRLSMDRADLGFKNKRFLLTEDNGEELIEILKESIKERKTLMLTLTDKEGTRESIVIPKMLLKLHDRDYLTATSSSENRMEVFRIESIQAVEILGVLDEQGMHFDIIIPKDVEDECFSLPCIKQVRSTPIGEEYLHVQGSIIDLDALADWLDELGDFEVLGPSELLDLFD